jgi:hypothetical protein
MSAADRLIDAVYRDDAAAVRRALANGIDVDGRLSDTGGYTALHIAAHLHSRGIVEVLLAAGADVHAADEHGNTPLHYATYPEVDPDRRPHPAVLGARRTTRRTPATSTTSSPSSPTRCGSP